MTELIPSLFLPQENWQADAACDVSMADYFFVEGTSGLARDSIRYARKICRGCPVIVECLKHAIKHNEKEGVWGGLTPAERGAIKGKVYSFDGISKDGLIRQVNERINKP